MLPKIITPEFETVIPSCDRTIRFRPFLVKEEKILLMAMQGGEQKDIIRAINQILENCVVDELDPNSLTFFDYEFLFLQIRSKSVGEISEFAIKHDCDNNIDISLNLEEVKVKGNIQDTIEISGDIAAKVRYPSIEQISNIKDESVDTVLNLFADCIVSVYDSNEVYDFDKKELKEWIETLPQSAAKNIVEFFQNMPKLSHELKGICPHCNEEYSQTLEGLQSFFQ